MVLGTDGRLYASSCSYDKGVAGVISGAGNYKPGIVLDKNTSENNRLPIALLGKVFCKVDATHGAVEVRARGVVSVFMDCTQLAE